MKAKKPDPADRRPTDPLMRSADAALRRAAVKARARAAQEWADFPYAEELRKDMGKDIPREPL